MQDFQYHEIPEWDLCGIFKDDEEFEKAAEGLRDKAARLERAVMKTRNSKDQDTRFIHVTTANELRNEVVPFAFDLYIYAFLRKTTSGVDDRVLTMNDVAGKLLGKIESMEDELDDVMLSLDNRASEEFYSHPANKPHEARMAEKKRYKAPLSDDVSRKAIQAMNAVVPGPWQNLYYSIMNSASVSSDERRLSISEAQAELQRSSESVRKAIWHKLASLTREKEVCALALDALIGWKIETLKLIGKDPRSKRAILEASLGFNKIPFRCVESLRASLEERRGELRKTAVMLAAEYGNDVLHPWDFLYEPEAEATALSFGDAVQYIREGFANISQEMAEFLDIALRRKWIDARPRKGKFSGAFTALVEKDGTSRCLVNFHGSLSDVMTLAHELGHGFHNWRLRSKSHYESEYPTCLGEAFAIFAANTVAETIYQQNRDLRKAVRRHAARFSMGTMMECMTRFDFELALYQIKSDEKHLNPDRLDKIYSDCWHHWFGNTFSGPFNINWMLKHQLYRQGQSFYNYHHTLGYLLAFWFPMLCRDGTLSEALENSGVLSMEQIVARYMDHDLCGRSFFDTAITNSLNLLARLR